MTKRREERGRENPQGGAVTDKGSVVQFEVAASGEAGGGHRRNIGFGWIRNVFIEVGGCTPLG